MNVSDIRQKVFWKDLRRLSAKEAFIENTITLPWLIGSLLFAWLKIYWLAVPCSIFFFLTGLRQVHNGFHNSLGTSSFLTELVLYINSVFMMVSIHAVKYNHLRHHKYEMSEKDYEAKSAKMSALGAILYGPVHIFMIHKVTFSDANRKYKKAVIYELILIGLFTALAFWSGLNFLIYHVIIMILGEFLTAFFAVWTVHHDTSDDPHLPRTQRTKWKNKLTYNMFYHLEHHLFPAVPTIKLPELARRIDEEFPDLKKKSTF